MSCPGQKPKNSVLFARPPYNFFYLGLIDLKIVVSCVVFLVMGSIHFIYFIRKSCLVYTLLFTPILHNFARYAAQLQYLIIVVEVSHNLAQKSGANWRHFGAKWHHYCVFFIPVAPIGGLSFGDFIAIWRQMAPFSGDGWRFYW